MTLYIKKECISRIYSKFELNRFNFVAVKGDFVLQHALDVIVLSQIKKKKLNFKFNQKYH